MKPLILSLLAALFHGFPCKAAPSEYQPKIELLVDPIIIIQGEESLFQLYNINNVESVKSSETRILEKVILAEEADRNKRQADETPENQNSEIVTTTVAPTLDIAVTSTTVACGCDAAIESSTVAEVASTLPVLAVSATTISPSPAADETVEKAPTPGENMEIPTTTTITPKSETVGDSATPKETTGGYGMPDMSSIGSTIGKLGQHGQQIASDVKNAVTSIIGQIANGISGLVG